jgi:Sec7-like guanine-nucleotide exchange factor
MQTWSVDALLQLNHESRQSDLQSYLATFDFSNLDVVQALRTFLLRFPLQGETQCQDRVLAAFAKQYQHNNSARYADETFVHRLVYAIILLNTDLTSEHVSDKMSRSAFIENTIPVLIAADSDLDNRKLVSDNLGRIYDAIRKNPLQAYSIGPTLNEKLESEQGNPLNNTDGYSEVCRSPNFLNDEY